MYTKRSEDNKPNVELQWFNASYLEGPRFETQFADRITWRFTRTSSVTPRKSVTVPWSMA